MAKEKKIKITVWIYPSVMQTLRRGLGVDDSKVIRSSMNCAVNVIHNLFGGEVKDIFRRRKKNEEIQFYEDP